jgi:Ni/Fe-hydrogenase subunit HybB-like protein
MLRVLAGLLAVVLIGIGLLAGGCSIAFTPSLFGSGEFEGSGNLPIWLAGVAVGAAGLIGGILIVRRLRRPPKP